jgi:xylulokinase
LTGGGARSPLWRQILADVFNSPVAIQPADEGPAYGAALLAATGSGAFTSIESAAALAQPTGLQEPRAITAAYYGRGKELFAEVYKALEPMYSARLALEQRSPA